MYIHIGGEYSVAARMIVAIFDLDQLTGSKKKSNILFLKKLEENARLEAVSPDLPKSLVLTVDRAYLSPISTHTLRQRLIDRPEVRSISMI